MVERFRAYFKNTLSYHSKQYMYPEPLSAFGTYDCMTSFFPGQLQYGMTMGTVPITVGFSVPETVACQSQFRFDGSPQLQKFFIFRPSGSVIFGQTAEQGVHHHHGGQNIQEFPPEYGLQDAQNHKQSQKSIIHIINAVATIEKPCNFLT